MLTPASLDGIRLTPSPHGLVIAVYGGWESGKTTFLNFVRHYLQEQEDEFVVIEFSPWWFSGRADLAAAFFVLLRARLQRVRGFTKKAQRKVARYGTAISSIPIPSAGLVGTASSAMALDDDVVQRKGSLEKTLASLVPITARLPVTSTS